jgi:hypothetical protein
MRTHALWIVGAAAALTVAACKDDSTEPASQTPQIAGCNSVTYKGTTFTNIGCAPGIASFDVEISQNGVSGHFHITCTGGCVATVTVI